jgi:hypothetical protein
MQRVSAVLLIACLWGCAVSAPDPPRYVWYCHIAGGGSCTGELIRCWDSQRIDWTDAAHCRAVVPKPSNLVNNQSWPPVSGTLLHPGRGR